MAIPAILGAAVRGAGALASRGGAAAFDGLKTAAVRAPGAALRLGGVDRIPLGKMAMDTSGKMFDRMTTTKRKQEERQESKRREDQRRKTDTTKRQEEQRQDQKEQQQQKRQLSEAQLAQRRAAAQMPRTRRNADQAEANEQQNADRQKQAHENTKSLGPDESAGYLKVIARDTTIIKDGIKALGDKTGEQKSSGLLGALASGLVAAVTMGLGVLQKGLMGLVGRTLSTLIPGVARALGGIAGRLLSGAGGLAARALGGAGGLAARAGLMGAGMLAGGKAAGAVAGRGAAAAAKAGTGIVGRTVAKGVGKAVLKKIPLIGAAAGLAFGAQRAMAGDWTGAGMEVASGAASTLPGLGTAASVGIDGALLARDLNRSDSAPVGSSTASAPKATKSRILAPRPPSVGAHTDKPTRLEEMLDRRLGSIMGNLANLTMHMTTTSRGIFVRSADQTAGGASFDAASPGATRATPAPRSTSSPASGRGSLDVLSGNSSMGASGDASQLLDLIAKGESGAAGYDAAWNGSRLRPSKPLSQMTFGEVKQWQSDTLNEQKGRGIPADRRSSAAGRYQFISSTLAATQERAGLSDDDMFSPENQDKIALNLLNADKNRGLEAWRSGRATDDQFSRYVASQWASIQNPGGGSQYNAAGFNHASIGAGSVISAARGQTQGAPITSSAGPRMSDQVFDATNARQQVRQAQPVAAPIVIPQMNIPGMTAKNNQAGASRAPMLVRSPDSPIRAHAQAVIGAT